MSTVSGSYNYNVICPVCGLQYKAAELRKRWDGLMVCEADWEPRHPMDFYRTRNDTHDIPYAYPDTGIQTSYYGLNFPGVANQSARVFKSDSSLDMPAAARPFPITLEVWVNPTNLGIPYQQVVSNAGSYSLAIRDVITNVAFTSSTFSYTFNSTIAVPTGVWSHIEIVSADSSGLTISLYDATGALVATQSGTFSANPGTYAPESTFDIGQWGGTKPFNGSIDDLRIWSQVQSPSDLAKYRLTRLNGGEDGLLTYWPFDDQNNTHHTDCGKVQSVYKSSAGMQLSANVAFVSHPLNPPA